MKNRAEKKELAEKYNNRFLGVVRAGFKYIYRQKKRELTCLITRHDWRFKDGLTGKGILFKCRRCSKERKV